MKILLTVIAAALVDLRRHFLCRDKTVGRTGLVHAPSFRQSRSR